MSEIGAQGGAPGGVSKAKPDLSDDEITSLIASALGGDGAPIPKVQALLAREGFGQTLVDGIGSPAEWLRRSIMAKAGGGSVLAQEAIGRKIDAVRAELEGPNPTPIERLLAERAAYCWFIVYWHEDLFHKKESMSIPEHDAYQQRIDRAHARFLSAVRTLAQVRKLAVPALQINVAKNQVNVAGGGS